MKKKAFGKGYWNGFGGKLRRGETIEESIRREVKEESGLVVREAEKMGVVHCIFKGTPMVVRLHIFKITSFSGQPVESNEMLPKWFNIKQAPIEQMWPGDKKWIKTFLSGEKFEGNIIYGKNNKVISSKIVRVKEFFKKMPRKSMPLTRAALLSKTKTRGLQKRNVRKR